MTETISPTPWELDENAFDHGGCYVPAVHDANRRLLFEAKTKDDGEVATAAVNSYDKNCHNPVKAAKNDLLGEAMKALLPFANFACELEPNETCNCFNCNARNVLDKSKE